MTEGDSGSLKSSADQVEMAIERTYLAHERTLLAWVRTGTSLVTFGLTLFKFFEFLHQHDLERKPPRLLGARSIGLFLVIIGIATLTMACWQFRVRTQRLHVRDPAFAFSPAYILAALMSALGIVTLLASSWEH